MKMEPERWRQIERLYYAALERAPNEREAFLAEACAGDESLRREVASLIVAGDRIGSFMEASADEFAETLATAPPPSVIGQTLGHYRIVSLLGRGGMGEVYLGEDTTLGRQVALKLLPAAFTSDRARLRRFEQEARAASALNHPNIITIHEIGQTDGRHYLVTEYIEGKTLRQRMAAGRMKLSEAVEVAVQVASALAAAHAAGITHRDIKPENVMVRPDGLVKVLDFGLAKLTETQAPTVDSQAATLAKLSTDTGVVLGTPRYMSPEQARGQKVDARSDIFSLGVVLYEMLAGRAPFAGVNALDVVGAILNQEPAPLRQHLPDLPAELQRIVSKALGKDREQRYQHSKDLLVDLTALRRELEFGAATNEVAAARATSSAGVIIGEIKRHKLGVGVALAILVAAVAGLAFGLYQLSGQNQAPNRASGPAPRVVPFTSFSGNECCPSFSPDGNQIAFTWNGEKGDNEDIYVKLVDAGAPLRLTTNPARDTTPAWSPDGRHIAFIRSAKDEKGIYLVPALGSQERKICALTPASSGLAYFLSWSPDGKLLAFSEKNSPQEADSIFLLSVESLEKRRLTSHPERRQTTTSARRLTRPTLRVAGDYDGAFSPDGKMLAFIRSNADADEIYLVPTVGGEPRRLTYDNRGIDEGLAWTPDGREIVFASNRAGSYNFWRIPIAGGTPERLVAGGDNVYALAINRQGNRLAYTQYHSDTNIWRYEARRSAGRTNAPAKWISSTQLEASPHYSADGKRIVFTSWRSGNREIWVCDSDGSNPTQITTFGGPEVGSPRWSPDGRQIVFDSNADGQKDIYVIGAGGGKARRLTVETSDEVRPSWSRDGQWIYFGSNRNGTWQVWKAPAEGGQAAQVTQQGGRVAYESPAGKFVYYTKGPAANSIWRTPVAGGEEVQVLDQVQSGQWAVTEQGIYFVNQKAAPRPTIEFFSFATARTARIAVTEKSVPLAPPGFTVSPDGRWILLVQDDQSESDIMLMENFR
jgi:Tol biopolymer transport system component/predicted Ser/Thr protein kinase